MERMDQKQIDEIAAAWASRKFGLVNEMKLKLEHVSANGVQIRMPFNPEFCADVEQTLLHGGILTALLDSAFGLVNFCAIPGLLTMATLDLRVDYLRPARSRADVIVLAKCYRETRHIAFDSGTVWFDGDETTEIARGAAAFALTRGDGAMFQSPL